MRPIAACGAWPGLAHYIEHAVLGRRVASVRLGHKNHRRRMAIQNLSPKRSARELHNAAAATVHKACCQSQPAMDGMFMSATNKPKVKPQPRRMRRSSHSGWWLMARRLVCDRTCQVDSGCRSSRGPDGAEGNPIGIGQAKVSRMQLSCRLDPKATHPEQGVRLR